MSAEEDDDDADAYEVPSSSFRPQNPSPKWHSDWWLLKPIMAAQTGESVSDPAVSFQHNISSSENWEETSYLNHLLEMRLPSSRRYLTRAIILSQPTSTWLKLRFVCSLWLWLCLSFRISSSSDVKHHFIILNYSN